MKKDKIFIIFTILLLSVFSIYSIIHFKNNNFEISVNQKIKLDSGTKISFDINDIVFDQTASAGDADGTTFNRYSLTYTSDVYVKGIITYKVNGVEENERFFLKPNTAYTFSSFINGYTDDVSAPISSITSLTFENISSNTGTINIGSFSLIQYPGVAGIINWITNDYGNGFNPNDETITEQQTLFLANDNITMGVSLKYGGSINYLSGDTDIFSSSYANVNLINNRDNGRLIQQAYYGNNVFSGDSQAYAVGTDCNSVNGQYNPIQGGFSSFDDGNSTTNNTTCGLAEGTEYNSKIVDIGISVEYEEGTSNIKNKRLVILTKPSLWELSNENYKTKYFDQYYQGYTADAYITSDYTLYDTYVDVNSSYIDFTDNMSAAENDWTTQSARSESPSMYTISSLDELYARQMSSDKEKEYAYEESDGTLALRQFINSDVQRSDGTYDTAIYSYWGGYFDTNSDGTTEGIGIYRPGYNKDNHEYLHGFVASNELTKNSTAASTNFITHILHFYNGNISQFKEFSYNYVITLGKINDEDITTNNEGYLNSIMWQYRYDHSYFLTVDPNTGIYAGSTEPVVKGYDSNGIEDENHKLLEYWGNLYGLATSEKTGYDFTGYYTAKTGGEKVYDNTGKAVQGTYWNVYTDDQLASYAVEEKYQYIGKKDLTVYAQYTPTVYSITYNLDGGTVSGNPSTYTIESSAITLKNPTKEGYTFIGWTGTDLSSTTATVKIPTGSIGNRTYTANYVKDSTITVNHYLQGTTTKLTTSETITKKYKETYSTSASSTLLSNYDLVSTPSNASGTANGTDITVNYYYILKTATITVHHYIKGTTTKLADDVVTTQDYTTKYTTSAANVDSNYELVSTPSNASGTVSGNITVTYYYQLKKGTITVHHYIKGTTTKLADDVVTTQDYTTKYTTSAANVDSNYELVSTPSNASGTVSGNETVTYYYQLKKGTITVHHYIKGTTTKLADDVVTTQDYTTKYTTSAASVGANYELVETPSNATGTVSGNITITYYYQLKTATITVNHYLEGTTDKISDTVTKTMNWGETYTTTKATDISNNYELVETPTNASGTVAGDVTVNYYYSLKEATLTVHYYIEGTTTELSKTITKGVNWGEKYETSSASDISNNYELVETPSNANGTISGNVTVTYYYQLKKGTITVHHYIKDTTTKLADDVITTQDYTTKYTTSAANVDSNYELVSTPSNANGTVSGNITVTYYYQLKTATLTVHYYLEGTTTELSKTITKTMNWGEEYTTSKASDISNNYELVSTPTNVTGTIAGDVTVNYYYRLKEGTLITHHYIKGTTTKLSDSVTKSVHWGDSYTTTKATDINENYELVETPSNANGTISADETIVIYYYQLKTATLKVNHYLEGTTDKLSDTVTKTMNWGETYTTTQATDINENYELVETPSNATGLIKGDVTVNYYYRLKEAIVTTNYYIEGTTTKLADSVTQELNWGDKYTTSPSADVSNNYELISTPSNATGTIKDNSVVVNYYYRLKEATLTVHHYIEGTTDKLTDSETSTVYWGDNYTTDSSSKVSTNYELVSTPTNASGTVSGDITVIYYYRLKTATITVYHYIEGTTTRLSDSVTITKKYTEEYTTNPATDIDTNYELVSTPSNATGTVDGNKTVIYYYKLKTATLTVHHYIEGTTTSLVADEISTVTYTHTYKTSLSTNISTNYELASTKGTLEGTVSGNIEVTYYYKLKSATLTVKHLENGTNTVLAPEETKEVKYGEKYTTSQSKDIKNNYELLRKTENYEGIVSSDTIEVIYYYQKKDSSLETTITQTVPLEITSKNQENDYIITYNAKITDYIGTATITIVEYLPYKIDEAKSDLNGGIYDSNTQTITWIETRSEIDSSEETKNITITKNIKIVYSNLDSKERSMTNTATGKIELDNNERETETQNITYIKIPGKIIVHHYLEGTTTKIVDDVETSNLVGETYISAAIEKDGYILKKEPENKNHIYQDELTEIIYEYERISISIITKVNGNGGTIKGDEQVYYGESSTIENIIIKPKDGYLVDKILINGEEIDATTCSNGCTLPAFINLTENKEIVVLFKEITGNPPTSSIITTFTITGLIIISAGAFILVKKYKPSIKKI